VVVGSLFAGIGGFDLAARWMGWRTAWVSEIDPFACQVLAHHFPDAPNHGDITQIDFTTVEPVDILVGGFPCQDISNAGKQAGIEGARSGLWFHYARAIRELRPRYVVVENVAALTNRGLDRVLGSLAEIGYDAEWGCFGAADVGAPHKRDRLWLLAYPNDTGLQGGERCGAASRAWQSHGYVSKCDRAVVGDFGGAVADTISQRGRSGDGQRQDAKYADASSEAVGWWRDAVPVKGADGTVRFIPREAQEEGSESPLWPVAHGVSGRVARLRGIGNAIVPQCATVLYEAIARREDKR
jgi:DNA (cytosine-5)-methyltransferase 1